MLDAETTAILTGAAGNIVAYMLSGRADALRSWVGRIFRRASEQQRSEQLRAVDRDIAALASRTTSETDVRARWAVTLATCLAAHPEARAELHALASTPTGSKSMYVDEQHNHGAGTFIGGDNYGRINAAATGEWR